MSHNLTLESHPGWNKFQSVPKPLAFFLEPDLNYDDRHTSRDRLREILSHFEVEPKYRRSTAVKADLVKAFKDHVLPQITPFIRPVADRMEVQDESTEATPHLDLTARTTTKAVIRKHLKKNVPTLRIPATMSKPDLIDLYKKHLMPANRAGTTGSPSGQNSTGRFSAKPPIWTHKELLTKRIDDIRFALHCYRPDIFFPTKCLTKDICSRAYEKLVLHMPVDSAVISEGVHYFIPGQQPPVITVVNC